MSDCRFADDPLIIDLGTSAVCAFTVKVPGH